MSNFYFISPTGYSSPGLFETFEKTFQDNGHSIVGNIDEANIVFFDFHSGLFDYNWELINKCVEKRLPIVCFDQFDHWTSNGEIGENVYDFDNLPKDKYWAKALKIFIDEGLVKVVFMRKMSKAVSYPPFVHPIELIQYTDHDFPVVSYQELQSRPFEICFIGNKATPRNNVCAELQKHFKCDFVLGEERLPHEEWLNRHRQSKLFLECGGGGKSGGGFGSERLFQLITISPMLELKTEQFRLNDFVDWVDCLRVNEMPTKEDVQLIRRVLDLPSILYEIYKAGIERMHKYFNEGYRTNYILDVLKNQNIL